MLKPSYAAMQQFQSQKNFTTNLQELKVLLKRLGMGMSLEITSSSFWKLEWDFLEDKICGTMGIGILPSLIIGAKTFEKRSSSNLRLEEPLPISFSAVEGKLLDLIKKSVEGIC